MAKNKQSIILLVSLTVFSLGYLKTYGFPDVSQDKEDEVVSNTKFKTSITPVQDREVPIKYIEDITWESVTFDLDFVSGFIIDSIFEVSTAIPKGTTMQYVKDGYGSTLNDSSEFDKYVMELTYKDIKVWLYRYYVADEQYYDEYHGTFYNEEYGQIYRLLKGSDNVYYYTNTTELMNPECAVYEGVDIYKYCGLNWMVKDDKEKIMFLECVAKSDKDVEICDEIVRQLKVEVK